MGKLKAAFNSTSVVQAIRKESLSNESIEGTKQAIAKSSSIPAAQVIKRESFSGECTSLKRNRFKKIHIIPSQNYFISVDST
jgi:hypothetical protein